LSRAGYQASSKSRVVWSSFLTNQEWYLTVGQHYGTDVPHFIPGNSVQLLKDAKENYPAWLAAIEGATRTIHFESYIIHEDECGRHFAEALSAKARAGESQSRYLRAVLQQKGQPHSRRVYAVRTSPTYL
jgi:phosphatidylserine/phosphatidylglycerophosphate/cardiolipin synthase-like enzyme